MVWRLFSYRPNNVEYCEENWSFVNKILQSLNLKLLTQSGVFSIFKE